MADVPRFREGVILRFTLARIADLFNACDQLSEPEKQAAHDEIRRRLKDIHYGATQDFAARCRELSALAPNRKIQNILLMIAQVCETDRAADVS